MRWLVALLLVAACSGGTDIDDIHVRAVGSVHHVSEPIEVRIVNLSRTDAYLPHCNHRASLLLERRMNGVWEFHTQVNGPYCLGIYPAGELLLERRHTHTETVSVDEAGEFRVRVYVRLPHEDFGSLLLDSAPFTVRYPPD